jgi:hypothetical protein
MCYKKGGIEKIFLIRAHIGASFNNSVEYIVFNTSCALGTDGDPAILP